MKKYLLLLLFAWISIVHAAVVTEINPPKVTIGETFSLTFSSENTKQQADMPDLTPLKKDFDIMGTERSLAFSIINGQTHSISRWTILLAPKVSGTITIPSIQIGNETSEIKTIEVSKEAAKIEPTIKAEGDAEVLLKTEANPSEVFVNQEILYTVKLYNKQNLIDVVYQPPKVENALMLPLSEGKRYQTVENGEAYIVEEERYAIFPQKSGSFKIIPPRFNALIYDFVPRKVNLQGKSLNILVKPIPALYNGKNWFPAKKVSLTEEFSETSTNLLQGSTLVRNITIHATGTSSELLPNLDYGSNQQFNIYPEKPETKTTGNHSELVTIAKIKITYLFNKAGDITIPELKLPWFNTNTGKQEIAVLPSRKLQIDAKEAHSNNQVSKTSVQNNASQQAISQQVKESEQTSKKSFFTLPWLIAFIFALAWLATLLLWFFLRNPMSQPGKRQALKNLHEACIRNDAVSAQTALMEWAKLQWPERKLLNLNDVGKQVSDPAFKKEIQLLSEALYSHEKKRFWVGLNLWQCIVNFRRRKKTKSKQKDLPPINPQ